MGKNNKFVLIVTCICLYSCKDKITNLDTVTTLKIGDVFEYHNYMLFKNVDTIGNIIKQYDSIIRTDITFAGKSNCYQYYTFGLKGDTNYVANTTDNIFSLYQKQFSIWIDLPLNLGDTIDIPSDTVLSLGVKEIKSGSFRNNGVAIDTIAGKKIVTNIINGLFATEISSFLGVKKDTTFLIYHYSKELNCITKKISNSSNDNFTIVTILVDYDL